MVFSNKLVHIKHFHHMQEHYKNLNKYTNNNNRQLTAKVGRIATEMSQSVVAFVRLNELSFPCGEFADGFIAACCLTIYRR